MCRFAERMGYDLDKAFSYPEHAVCQGRKQLFDRKVLVREAFYRYVYDSAQRLTARGSVSTLHHTQLALVSASRTLGALFVGFPAALAYDARWVCEKLH